MLRREFIAGPLSVATWPRAARAQQPAMPLVGFISSESADDDSKNAVIAFLQPFTTAAGGRHSHPVLRPIATLPVP
jgi:hypothetical protein